MEKTNPPPSPHRDKVKYRTVKHYQNKQNCSEYLKQTTIFRDNSEKFKKNFSIFNK